MSYPAIDLQLRLHPHPLSGTLFPIHPGRTIIDIPLHHPGFRHATAPNTPPTPPPTASWPVAVSSLRISSTLSTPSIPPAPSPKSCRPSDPCRLCTKTQGFHHVCAALYAAVDDHIHLLQHLGAITSGSPGGCGEKGARCSPLARHDSRG